MWMLIALLSLVYLAHFVCLVCGVKGVLVLLSVNQFDVVNGVVVD